MMFASIYMIEVMIKERQKDLAKEFDKNRIAYTAKKNNKNKKNKHLSGGKIAKFFNLFL